MSQLKKGASLTYLNLLLSNTIGLVLTPFIIKSLGNSEYGLYTLIGSFVAYLTLLDLGINNSIVRYLSKYQLEKDYKGQREFLSTTVWIYFVIALVLVFFGIIIFYNIENIFANSLSRVELERAKTMFLILIFNLAVTIPGGIFEAICNAYQYFVFPRLLKIFKYILRATSIFAILTLGGKAISLVIIDTVLNVLIIIATGIFVIYKLRVEIKLNLFKKDLVKEIFGYSFWVFLYGIVNLFQWNAGQVVLGITSSTVIVAIFGVGVMLGGYYNAFGAAINSLLIPRAMSMVVSKQNGGELTKAMITVGRLNGYLMFLILTSFFLVGQQFIILWVGENYENSYYVALAMMGGMTLLLYQVFGNSILEAQKKNKFKSVLSFVTVGIAVIVGYFLSVEYGVFGMILPLATAMVINGFIMNFYFIKIFKFEPRLFYKEVLLKQTVVYGSLSIATFFILKKIVILNWWQLLGVSLVYGIIFILFSLLFVMNKFEKAQFKKIFK